jgi:hypothetical protein
MSLILRNIKGSPLTWTEGDNNLTYLESLATGLSSSISGGLSNVLSNSNSTGTYSIEMGNSTTIDAENGGGQLDLRYGGDDNVLLSNDGGAYGDSQLNLTPGYIELSSYAVGGETYIYADEINIESNVSSLSLSPTSSNFFYKETGSNTITAPIFNIWTRKGAPLISLTGRMFGEIQVVGDIGSPGKTGHLTDATYNNAPVVISARNATIDDVTNTVVLGGTGITATMSNTVYVPDLVIQSNKTIKAASGLGQLDLRYGGDNRVMLSTDGGAYAKEYLNMEPGYIELSAVDTGGSRIAMYADEYDAGLLVGSVGGTATSDFEAYGKNGFVLRNLTLGGSEELIIKHDDGINIDSLIVSLPTIPTYANNADAITGGLVVNNVYKTATGELRIVI